MFIESLVMHGEHRRIFCGYVIAITSPVVHCITCGAATIPNGIGGGTYLLQTTLYFIYRGQQAENAPVRDQFIEIEILNQDDGEEEEIIELEEEIPEEEIPELEEEIPELVEEIPDEEIPELEEKIPEEEIPKLEEEIPELVEIQVMGDDKKHLVFEMIWEELY
ncbi:hypothetical protein GH714_021173 [Hevea brasiliensis]|uniref:Uncharacterized protein n=1 Tax=Hevea brasiliensis TaxID=3981 RepID=A0A6A6L9T6_HEVBR|nr:hypothetical protein GH714_021173 [Hevea brasiliensis]